MSSCPNCSNLQELSLKYLAPEIAENEFIILGDKENNTGVINLFYNTMTLDKNSMTIIKDTFVNIVSTPVSKLITNHPDSDAWISILINKKVFKLVDEPAQKELLNQYFVKKGEAINPDSSDPVIVDCDGTVVKIRMNNSLVYSYTANKNSDIPQVHNDALKLLGDDELPTSSVVIDNVISQYETCPKLPNPPVAITPEKVTSNSSVGISPCTGCLACSTCAACAFCAEINFGVAAASTTAAAYTIHVNN